MKAPIFNDAYEVIDHLGEGKCSKVYLCKEILNPLKMVALKLYKQEYLSGNADAIKTIEREIQILHGLDHPNINKIIGYGSDGKVVKGSGRIINNLLFVIVEYIPGGIFFNLC